MTLAPSTRRWLISGKVQGVGFRYFVRREAEFVGLVGWVKNLADGRVEVVARGAEEGLEALAARLSQGPPAGRVDSLDEAPIHDEPTGNEFLITF